MEAFQPKTVELLIEPWRKDQKHNDKPFEGSHMAQAACCTLEIHVVINMVK